MKNNEKRKIAKAALPYIHQIARSIIEIWDAESAIDQLADGEIGRSLIEALENDCVMLICS